MGYNLYIERRDKKAGITKKEWLDYLQEDEEFEQIETFSSETNDGTGFIASIPNAGLWNKEVPFTFDEEEGNISVKNPDEVIIKKMLEIASLLNAQVLGEEGEVYNEEYLKKEDSLEEIDISKYKIIGLFDAKPKRWWEFWK